MFGVISPPRDLLPLIIIIIIIIFFFFFEILFFIFLLLFYYFQKPLHVAMAPSSPNQQTAPLFPGQNVSGHLALHQLNDTSLVAEWYYIREVRV